MSISSGNNFRVYDPVAQLIGGSGGFQLLPPTGGPTPPKFTVQSVPTSADNSYTNGLVQSQYNSRTAGDPAKISVNPFVVKLDYNQPGGRGTGQIYYKRSESRLQPGAFTVPYATFYKFLFDNRDAFGINKAINIPGDFQFQKYQIEQVL